MEMLRWFLEGLMGLIGDFMDLLGRAVGALASEFDLDLAPDLANLMGIVLGVLIIWGSATAMLKWDRKGSQPQAFPLKTEKTPNQVVAADWNGFLSMVIRVVLFTLLLAVLISLRT